MNAVVIGPDGLAVEVGPVGTRWRFPELDRLHVTDGTLAAIRSRGTWAGSMPDPRTLKDQDGVAFYTAADLRAHRDMLLRMTDWAASSPSTSAAVAETRALRAALLDLPKAHPDPTTVVFPRLSSWDAEHLSPTLADA